MQGLSELAKKHLFETLISALLMALIAIYCHALYEQKDIQKRVRSNEALCVKHEALIAEQTKAIDQRTEMLRRELDQRTAATQAEIKNLCTQFESQIGSLERTINILVGALKENGIRIKEAKDGIPDG